MYFVLGTICLRIYLALVYVQNESTILSFRILKWFLSNINSYYVIVILGKAYYFILSSMQANYLVNLTHATSHKDSAQNAFYWLVIKFLYLIITVSRTTELREWRKTWLILFVVNFWISTVCYQQILQGAFSMFDFRALICWFDYLVSTISFFAQRN